MNKKNIFIIGLAVAILVGATAFAAFAQELNILGTANVNAAWNVEITDATETSVDDATTVAISSTETSATFEVDMEAPGGTAVYNVEITNGGTIDAKLASITGLDTVNALEPLDITYAITGVVEDQLLAAGTTHNAVITVEWLEYEGQPELAMNATKTATITFNYVQDID